MQLDPDDIKAIITRLKRANGHLASVMQKGYVLNDRLLRPALVLVAK